MEVKQNWTYCVVGNIRKTHFDEDGVLRYGTAAFTGGTKVYLSGRLWDRRRGHIDALGLNRRNALQVDWTDISLIENVRCQRVFQPTVLKIMDHWEFRSGWWGRSKHEKADAEGFVEWWNETVPSAESCRNP